MKKWLVLLAAAALLFTAAFAEDMVPVIDGVLTLEMDESYELDLDGDGTVEHVCVRMDFFEDEEAFQLRVETDDAVYTYSTYILYQGVAYAADLDADGAIEVLLCGDEASADFFTWCLKFDPAQGIYPLPFADANRSENTDEYFDMGYGRIDAIDGNTLTMSGSQDMLGTWWCSREFTLRDGRFDLDDDGVWHVMIDMDDPDVWEYKSLTLVRELKATAPDGSAITLQPGERFVITETDKKYAAFQTQDGVTGVIVTEPDTENGWGCLIDGISEFDYFEYVPYSD